MSPLEETIFRARCIWIANILIKLKYAPSTVSTKELLSLNSNQVPRPKDQEDELIFFQRLYPYLADAAI